MRVINSKEDKGTFYMGVVSAIAAIKHFDQPSMVQEILDTCGEREVLFEARASNNMHWSGLDKFLRQRKKNKR
jgi:hypothetical protein